MDPRLQAKLLQVLQDEEFYRVGGKRSVRVDARVVVATNRNLEAAIRAGHVPRGPLLPAQRRDDPRAAAARAQGGDRPARARTSSRSTGARYRGGLEEVPHEVMERFHALRLAGQRPRAREPRPPARRAARPGDGARRARRRRARRRAAGRTRRRERRSAAPAGAPRDRCPRTRRSRTSRGARRGSPSARRSCAR